ncbi:TIGR02530 family flagellar biosynthesis protein [Paenibacillus polygoni]|uniref:TIGR02530 family flagellar biosynthesis protein n=1 Tax=Paenibacillus polygoni TaxID=3050112 RepID=A0ABY8X9G9_9BACL|nr:TIGR02530 family flagellar biosynthesis protein [Paenibacillus polygoni]WIV20783.1 TIGR02530 family flagellar biosynthesis protein [Paenibacillus polygoni]
MSGVVRVGQLYASTVKSPSTRDTHKSISEETVSFNKLLDSECIKLSYHASKRLEQRGIELGKNHLEKIAEAVDKAAAKGSKETLVLMEETAFIVNVKNRTIVTAVNGPSLTEGVFTQIDSAVIIS